MAKMLTFNFLFVMALLMPAEASAFVRAASLSSNASGDAIPQARPEKTNRLERLVMRKVEKKLQKKREKKQGEKPMEGFSAAGAVLAILGLLLLFTETAGIGALMILAGGILSLIGLIRIASHPGRFRKGGIAFAVLALIPAGLLLAIMISFGSQS